jgi:hypothetical protein
MSNTSPPNNSGGVAGTVTKTADKIVDTIGSPVLITLIILAAGAIGAIIWIWDKQSERNMHGYIKLVDECLPNREKL